MTPDQTPSFPHTSLKLVESLKSKGEAAALWDFLEAGVWLDMDLTTTVHLGSKDTDAAMLAVYRDFVRLVEQRIKQAREQGAMPMHFHNLLNRYTANVWH